MNTEFEDIYRAYKNLIYNLALKYLQNIEDAEEVTQDVFVKIFHSIDQFKADSELKTWIYRITINKSLDFIKSKNAQKRKGFLTSIFQFKTAEEIPINNHFDHPGVSLESREEVETIMHCINLLPDNQKTALILHKLEEKSQSEIAEIMNTSAKAIESLVQRGKKNLQKLLLERGIK